MLTWPHPDTDWGPMLDRVYPVFARLGTAIAEVQVLLSVCRSAGHAADVARLLHQQGACRDRLRFAVADSNDSWARDHGPLTTLDGARALLNDFRFNGWGGKFAAARDTAINGQLHRQGVFAGTPLQRRSLVLEGGALETDGAGTLLATRSSVIAANRNPGCSVQELERRLGEWLGIDRFLWLDHGHLSGDDTDGHIDTLARFVDPETIVYATAPAGDPDHAALVAMAGQLRRLRVRDGRPYRLLPLPWPGVHRDRDGRRLPATYANFLIVNGRVLLPVYNVAQDDAALAVLRQVLPDRQVVPIDCRRLIEQHGSLHCLAMQFPATVELRNSREFTAA